MADTNGIVTTGLLIAAGVIVGRLSNSLATDISRGELHEKSEHLGDLMNRSYSYVPELKHRNELSQLEKENTEIQEELQPSVKRAAKKLAKKAKRKTSRAKGWAKRAYSAIPFVGGSDDEDEGDQPKPRREVGESEQVEDESIRVGIEEKDDLVRITMPKSEWEQLNLEDEEDNG